MIAAATGGRREDSGRICTLSPHQASSLLALVDDLGITYLVHGGAIGYDRAIARMIRENRPRVELKAYPPLLEIDGEWPRAGHRRNRRMLKESGARVLIALPGNSGTANCVSEALSMGLGVWEWQGDRDSGRFILNAVGT